MGKYDDIINMPHHQSATRPHMSIHERAAQFSPFAALTGHDAAIAETARLTDKKTELDQQTKEILDNKLRYMIENIKTLPKVEITYFEPDKKKEGGSYKTAAGYVKRIDMYRHTLVFNEGNEVPLENIVRINTDKTNGKNSS